MNHRIRQTDVALTSLFVFGQPRRTPAPTLPVESQDALEFAKLRDRHKQCINPRLPLRRPAADCDPGKLKRIEQKTPGKVCIHDRADNDGRRQQAAPDHRARLCTPIDCDRLVKAPGAGWALLFAASLPVSGLLAYRYLGGVGRLRGQIRFGVIALTRHQAASRLLAARQAIVGQLDDAKREYLGATRGSSF